MSTGALDPLIHNPQRLRIVATLAALPDGDGRAALDRYTAMLRQLPPVASCEHHAPAPGMRAGDADSAPYARHAERPGTRPAVALLITCWRNSSAAGSRRRSADQVRQISRTARLSRISR
jgi:hypothetical protein